jgi:hypothetical protein
MNVQMFKHDESVGWCGDGHSHKHCVSNHCCFCCWCMLPKKRQHLAEEAGRETESSIKVVSVGLCASCYLLYKQIPDESAGWYHEQQCLMQCAVSGVHCTGWKWGTGQIVSMWCQWLALLQPNGWSQTSVVAPKGMAAANKECSGSGRLMQASLL